jgi:hypothetical protein
MANRTVQHSHLVELLDRLKICNRQIQDLTEGQGDLLNWQPPEGGWSMAMVLEHLYTTSDEYFGVVKPAMARGSENKSMAAWKPGITGKIFLNALQKPTKLKAPKKFQPTIPRDDMVSLFIQQQEELASLIQQADGLNLRRIKFGSPVSSLLRFSLGDCFAILITHQERHLKQIEGIKGHTAFPG